MTIKILFIDLFDKGVCRQILKDTLANSEGHLCNCQNYFVLVMPPLNTINSEDYDALNYDIKKFSIRLVLHYVFGLHIKCFFFFDKCITSYAHYTRLERICLLSESI